MTMQIELTSLRNESDLLSVERREALERALERTRNESAALEERWQAGTRLSPDVFRGYSLT
jgi:ATP-dependent Clp protease ATP-binding subunit ClpB